MGVDHAVEGANAQRIGLIRLEDFVQRSERDRGHDILIELFDVCSDVARLSRPARAGAFGETNDTLPPGIHFVGNGAACLHRYAHKMKFNQCLVRVKTRDVACSHARQRRGRWLEDAGVWCGDGACEAWLRSWRARARPICPAMGVPWPRRRGSQHRSRGFELGSSSFQLRRWSDTRGRRVRRWCVRGVASSWRASARPTRCRP